MKELNLQEYGVSELNAEEMKTVDGGMLIRLGYRFLIALPLWFMVALGIGAY